MCSMFWLHTVDSQRLWSIHSYIESGVVVIQPCGKKKKTQIMWPHIWTSVFGEALLDLHLMMTQDFNTLKETEASVSVMRPSWLSRMLRGTETSRKQKKLTRGISIIHFNTTVRGQECLCTSATSNPAAFKHVLLRLKCDLWENYGSKLHSLDKKGHLIS